MALPQHHFQQHYPPQQQQQQQSKYFRNLYTIDLMAVNLLIETATIKMRPEVAANDAMESLAGRLMECGPEK
ncbi:hypothetical protein ACFX13_000366 [Malus domestica]